MIRLNCMVCHTVFETPITTQNLEQKKFCPSCGIPMPIQYFLTDNQKMSLANQIKGYAEKRIQAMLIGKKSIEQINIVLEPDDMLNIMFHPESITSNCCGAKWKIDRDYMSKKFLNCPECGEMLTYGGPVFID